MSVELNPSTATQTPITHEVCLDATGVDEMVDSKQERAAPWTIKNIRVETRKLALACSARQGLSMGEWVERAVRNQAELEKRNAILPPGPERDAKDVVVYAEPQVEQVLDPAPELKDIDFDRMAAFAVKIGELAPGVPNPLVQELVATAKAHLRVARGLPPHRRGKT